VSTHECTPLLRPSLGARSEAPPSPPRLWGEEGGEAREDTCMFVYLYVVALRALLGSNGSSPEAEAKGLPFGIVRAAVSLNHSSAARQVCWAPARKREALA